MVVDICRKAGAIGRPDRRYGNKQRQTGAQKGKQNNKTLLFPDGPGNFRQIDLINRIIATGIPAVSRICADSTVIQFLSLRNSGERRCQPYDFMAL